MPSCSTSPSFNVRVLTLVAASLLTGGLLRAEVCTTQSQMQPVDRDTIAATARSLASLVQANDAPGLRQRTLPEYSKDFSGMASLVGSTAPRLTGASLAVEQVYLLDATSLKPVSDSTSHEVQNQDAQFFCSLNKSMAEANFLIPALPPGRYAFAMVTAQGTKSPWRLSFLLKQNVPAAGPQGGWLMAGFYPRPLTAASHDGIWYWTQARDLVKGKQIWGAYLYYEEAQALLQPAAFVTSTHLDKLRREAESAAPPALSTGISADTPLVIKAKNGSEFRFTDLTTDDSLSAEKVDIVAHLAPDPVAEPATAADGAAAKSKGGQKGDQKADGKPSAVLPASPLSPRERNDAAMAALLGAYPELRNLFHGVWIFADSPGKNPFVTEQPMANIH